MQLLILPETGIKITCELGPVSFADGMIALYQSPQDRTRGPVFSLDLLWSKPDDVAIKFKGGIKLIDVEASVSIILSPTLWQYAFAANLLGFDASINITTTVVQGGNPKRPKATDGWA